MTIRPDSRSRARTRTGIRTARRISPCYRHPDEPVTGICPSCLRERLSGLDSAAASPELRRCRSVAPITKCEASSSRLHEPRRKSCDVVSSQSSLCNLFDVDDLKSGSECEAIVESKNVGMNVGLSKVTYTVIGSKSKKDNNNNNNNYYHDKIRVSSHKKMGGLNADDVDSDVDTNEGEFKTMKEHIDLEFQTKTKKPKDFREIAGNLLGAASVFTRKLRNWRHNNNNKIKNNKNSSNCNARKLGEGHNSEIMGRRSCDTEPRFSVDAGPIPFDEPRASWDGYMIARTIPRLAPMFSVVENGILGNMNKFENRRLSVDGPTMHSIVEDESSSGASGSGHSNSDSSFSMRRSSFDRSSSVRSFGKKAVTSPANVKLVITEKELKDWRLSDGLERFGPADTESDGKSNGAGKKTIRWRKVRNVLGFSTKNGESERNAIDPSGGKLTRSTSVVGPRNNPCDDVESNYRRMSVDNAGGYDFKLERDTSSKYGSDELGKGIMPVPFYMTPLRSLKHCKSGKFELRKSPLSVDGSVLRLN